MGALTREPMIIDPRFNQLAAGLTGFSTELKPGERVLIDAFDVPDAMVIALVRTSTAPALAPLRGRIRQRAPIYSALKQGGEPLYLKARRGEVIEAPERQVEVHAIEVLEQQPERLRLRVTCGSGTYIRSLARDLGEALGCGAHISALRRLWVEPFREPVMVTLDQLRAMVEAGDEAGMDALLLPLAAGLAEYPRVDLDADQAHRFCVGQRQRDQAKGDAVLVGDVIRSLGPFHRLVEAFGKALRLCDDRWTTRIGQVKMSKLSLEIWILKCSLMRGIELFESANERLWNKASTIRAEVSENLSCL